MNSTILSILQPLLIILLAPLTVGCIRKVKARLQNRRGASVFLPYWTIATLCKKEMTITTHSSWVFRIVPFVVLGSAVLLALLMPTLGYGGWMTFMQNNIFLIAALMVIGSLFLVFGGMDVASAFGGMGSSREMTLAALIEPSVIIAFVAFGISADEWHLDGIIKAFATQGWYLTSPFLIFALLALLCVILTENARYPVDNPATHLELTMVHEAMILEYSGPYLAMLETASAIKLTVMAALFMNILLPFGLATPASGIGGLALSVILLLLKVLVASAGVALIESTIVKMRFYRMQEFMTTSYLLGLMGLVLTLALR